MCKNHWTCVRCLDAHSYHCWEYHECQNGHKICPDCVSVWNGDLDEKDIPFGNSMRLLPTHCPGCQLVVPCPHCGVEFVRVNRLSAEPYDPGLL